MTCFVLTGCNGFIGTNLVQKVLAAQPEDFGLIKSALPKFSNFEKDAANQTPISVIASDTPESLTRGIAHRFVGSARYQYQDYKSLLDYLEHLDTPPDIVIHNGACSSTTETNPQVFAELNLGYSQKIWEYCTRKQVPLIYASSAATYGDGKNGFSDKKEDCSKYTSLNLYGKSKLDFDLWVLEQKQTPPTWFGLRYFNVFGQFESHKGGQASMVYHGYNQATRTGKIKLFKSNTPVYKDGDQVRDFIYIDDLIDVTMDLIRLCFDRKKDPASHPLPENGLLLNVGTGVARTWNDLAESIFDSLSLPLSIEYIDMPENIKHQYQNYTCADLTTLRSIGIGHKFKTLEDGVAKYVQKHLVRGQ